MFQLKYDMIVKIKNCNFYLLICIQKYNNSSEGFGEFGVFLF